MENQEGVVLPGNKLEVAITVYVKEPVTEAANVDCVLALRLDLSHADVFLSFGSRLVPSIRGVALADLPTSSAHVMQQQESSAAAASMDSAPMPTTDSGDSAGGIMTLRDDTPNGSTGVDPSGLTVAASKEKSVEAASVVLPIPKELWWLLAFIYTTTTSSGASKTSGVLSEFLGRGRVASRPLSHSDCSDADYILATLHQGASLEGYTPQAALQVRASFGMNQWALLGTGVVADGTAASTFASGVCHPPR